MVRQRGKGKGKKPRGKKSSINSSGQTDKEKELNERNDKGEGGIIYIKGT